jgi:hypothetical protein
VRDGGSTGHSGRRKGRRHHRPRPVHAMSWARSRQIGHLREAWRERGGKSGRKEKQSEQVSSISSEWMFSLPCFEFWLESAAIPAVIFPWDSYVLDGALVYTFKFSSYNCAVKFLQ